MAANDDILARPEFRSIFDGPALRCGCGHVYEEMPEQGDADWTEDGDPIDPVQLADVLASARTLGERTLVVFDWQCPECGSRDAPALITVNHLDEYERAWEELGDDLAMIVERKPEMRDELAARIDETARRCRSILEAALGPMGSVILEAALRPMGSAESSG